MSVQYRPERKRNPWRVRVRVKGHEPVSEHFATEEEARAYEAEVKLRIRRGELVRRPAASAPAPAPQGGTIRDAVRVVLRGMRDGSVRNRSGAPYRPQSVIAYEAFLRRHVVPRIGGMAPAALTRGDVVRLRDEILAAQGAATARNAIIALSVVLRRSVERGELEANVATALPPLQATRRREIRFLEPAEAEALMRAADREGIGTLVRVAIATGLRRGELEGLEWGDLETGALRVRRQARRDGSAAPTKSGRPRLVPIGADTERALRQLHREAGEPGAGERVFGPLGAGAWDRAREAVATPRPRFHDLRHTCATFLLAAGLRVHEVAEVLGHATPELVIRLYGHALPEEVSTAGEVMDRFLARDPERDPVRDEITP